MIILGQSFGIIVYLRNLKLIQHHERGDQHGEEETLGETLQADASDAEDAEPISPESEPVAVPRTPPKVCSSLPAETHSVHRLDGFTREDFELAAQVADVAVDGDR